MPALSLTHMSDQGATASPDARIAKHKVECLQAWPDPCSSAPQFCSQHTLARLDTLKSGKLVLEDAPFK